MRLYHAFEYRLWEEPLVTRNNLVLYGKCIVHPAGVAAGAWFVSIPWGKYYPDEMIRPAPPDDVTFIVPAKVATLEYLKRFGRNPDAWSQVALAEIAGAWCLKYECIWKRRPVFQLKLEDGVQVKYGLCRTQADYEPSRELWFVSLKVDGSDGHTFVVDDVCSRPEFIRAMGSDWERGWMKLCWSHLVHEASWDDIGSRDDDTYVTSRHFALDSPYKPETVADNYRVLSEVLQQRKAQAPRKRRHFI